MRTSLGYRTKFQNSNSTVHINHLNQVASFTMQIIIEVTQDCRKVAQTSLTLVLIRIQTTGVWPKIRVLDHYWEGLSLATDPKALYPKPTWMIRMPARIIATVVTDKGMKSTKLTMKPLKNSYKSSKLSYNLQKTWTNIWRTRFGFTWATVKKTRK